MSLSWLDRWKRSPRQDRRVVIDGKFVELAPPLATVVKEQESALEVITEEQNGTVEQGTSTGTDVLPDQTAGSDNRVDQQSGSVVQGNSRGEASATEPAPDVDVPTDTNSQYEADVDAAFRFLTPEEIEAKGLTVLSSPGTLSLGEDLLDGKTGRTESEKLQEELEPLPTSSDDRDWSPE